jgi:hypothetical protein
MSYMMPSTLSHMPLVIDLLNVMVKTSNPELPDCVWVIRSTRPIQVTL